MVKRWIREASVGPEIAIFCNGGSSMAAYGGERENLLSTAISVTVRSFFASTSTVFKIKIGSSLSLKIMPQIFIFFTNFNF